MAKQFLAFLFAASTLFGLHDATASFRDSCARKLRALLPNAAGKTSFYLGKKISPSHLSYQDLAWAIEKRFEEFEHVQVLSIKHSLDSVINKLPPRSNYFEVFGLKLRFKAEVDFYDQNFLCRMSAAFDYSPEPAGVAIHITDCKNSQGLILEDFIIADLLSLKIRKIKAKNL